MLYGELIILTVFMLIINNSCQKYLEEIPNLNLLFI